MKELRVQEQRRWIPDWMLSLGLLSHKTLNLIIALFFVCIIVGFNESYTAIAQKASNWTISVTPGLEPEDLSHLRQKYPVIETNEDLQSFLHEMNRLQSFSELYADYNDGQWIIKGKRALVIQNIRVNLITRDLRDNVNKVLHQYIGQVDSDEIRDKILKEIHGFLISRGFLQAEVRFKQDSYPTDIYYTYDIRPGYPCTLKNIYFGFDLPKSVKFDLKPGDICDIDDVNSAVDSLRDSLRSKSYVQFQIDSPSMVYDTENNFANLSITGKIGDRITFIIEANNRRFLLGDILGEDLTKIDSSFLGVDTIANDIADNYRSRGYDDVVVSDPIVQKGEDSDLIYRYKVDTGVRYYVNSIQFQGNHVFSEKELLSMLDASQFFKSYLNIDQTKRGIENIKSEYRKLGYWDVEIAEPRLTKNSEEASAQISITINEGPQRILSRINIQGNLSFDSSKIIDLIDLESGQSLDYSQVIELERKVREFYLADGYLYVNVKTELKYESSPKVVQTELTLNINEGSRVQIGDIRIIGNVKVRSKVIKRELRFKTGDWHDPEQIDATRRALLSLGLFSKVQISPADPNITSTMPSVLNLLIEVQESTEGVMTFGPGWSLYRGGRFGIEASYNNIGGVGRQISGKLNLSEEANQVAIGSSTLLGRNISVGYLEPYIFNNVPINGTISLMNSAAADEQWVYTTAGELGFTYRFRKYVPEGSLTLFYGQRLNRERGTGDQKRAYLQYVGGNVQSHYMGLRLTTDFRDDLGWPTKGLLFSSELRFANYAFGGDLQYTYWKATLSHYLKLAKKFVLATGISLAAHQKIRRDSDFHADFLPISQTTYAGGAESVRGFQERTLGPKVEFTGDKGNEEQNMLGGSHSAVYKLELRYQISSNFAISAFTDAGNVFFSDSEIESFYDVQGQNKESSVTSKIVDNVDYKFSDLLTHPQYIWQRNYTSYGLALNYLTPLGSVNFAWGLPWKKTISDGGTTIPRGRKWGEIHLNIGTTF